ncbi:MBL fold metallo-hydrolase [Breznakia pachnodae]|uniref:Glyoxylase-like metal-dependent hydrolase (Beta-lactamase superfamily II) n=1 Tax=Breznakia pachnodae TaxID=265178 RepID=A0ABU0E0G7_9FIRM|nr:MBL fold metallo-hydrolase [Breznakia pachnodae]MDQ0360376.1 glyoxylase-like metal-dependent hydrolase (beta-lactamase superfamily II) [Breznakia pachnodae]
MNHFKSEYISDKVIRIIDPINVAMYLVIGDNKACLIDTGDGFGNLSEYVKTLTDKPVFVVLTHGHVDHVGGAGLFEDVYLNPKDYEVYREHSSQEYRSQFFGQFPGGDEFMKISCSPIKDNFHPLSDKESFDLGGISIEAIEVAGHTKGTMMMLIPEEKMMLFGDACGVSVLLFEDYATTVEEYRTSLLRIKKEYESKYNRVIRNHGTFESDPSILDNVISCCDDILNKQDDHVETEVFGEKGFYYAKRVDQKGQRIDGVQGNLIYRFDKVQ